MTETLLIIFLLSMAPIGELNGGIPYGIVKGVHPLLVYAVAVLGNMIPPAILLLTFPRLEKLLGIPALAKQHRSEDARQKKYHGLLDKALAVYLWWREKTKHGISKKSERWGTLALISYIAIPGPFTGAWSASLASYILGIPYRKALFAIFIGVLLAGTIILLISVGFFTTYETYTLNQRFFARELA